MSKADKTKDHIIKASAGVFNQKGYAATSMNDIMNHTGLTKGGLYGNFKSKEEIALAAFDHAVAIVWQRVRARTSVIENAQDKLKAVVYYYKEKLFTPPVEGGCPILNAAIESTNRHDQLQHRVAQALKHWESAIVKTLRAGIERGEVREDANVEAFATLFIATLEGGIMMARTYRDSTPFDIVTRQLIFMIDNLRN